jgi:WhiB family transcriptional regulator, redox-sensing transcriptional regulator
MTGLFRAGSATRLPAGRDDDWKTDALCGDLQSDMFFPEDPAQAAPAIQICAGCPVRLQCRDYALRHSIVWGIWGGMTGEDRERLIRRRAAKRRAAAGRAA